MRTIAVGDIHGCAAALAKLLELLAPSPDDQFVFLGDYVDRGPDSRGVLQQIVELSGRVQVTGLLGNHEFMLLESVERGEAAPYWRDRCGGAATLSSYGKDLAKIPAEHLAWLRSCKRYHETASHAFVHANYDPRLPFEFQPLEKLLWEHLDWPPPAAHCSGKTVVVGHTPQRSGRILDLGHLVCLDTACCMGGWLTALDVDSGAWWQANLRGDTRRSRSGGPPPPSGS